MLRGLPVRTQQTLKPPLTLDCEFLLDARIAHDGAFSIVIQPAGAKRKMSSEAVFVLSVGYQVSQMTSTDAGVQVSKRETLHAGRMVWGLEPMKLESKQWYRLHWQFDKTGSQLTIGDKAFKLTGVAIPYEEFQIELNGWQPSNTFRVRNFTVH